MKYITWSLLLLYSVCSYSSNSFADDFVNAANDRTTQSVRYDGAYQRIAYPNGDVPANIGVCTDVIIRSYRALGIDLQKLVHEDMRDNFSSYPSQRIWGLNRPDSNIDHRRVPNLQTFFRRHGIEIAVSQKPEDYHPGAIVSWILPGNLPHIGIVTDQLVPGTKRPLIVHNIGAGPQLEDVLFDYPITGNFHFFK